MSQDTPSVAFTINTAKAKSKPKPRAGSVSAFASSSSSSSSSNSNGQSNASASSSSSSASVDSLVNHGVSLAEQERRKKQSAADNLVIPLQRTPQWKEVDAATLQSTLSLDAQAAQSLLQNTNVTAADTAESADDGSSTHAHLPSSSSTSTTSSSSNAPILATAAHPLVQKARSQGVDDDRLFKLDLLSRPEQASLADYERVPVDNFGAAMMRGMGWSQGMGVGRSASNSTLVQPIEFVPRPDRAGLGAEIKDVPPPPSRNKKRHKKPSEHKAGAGAGSGASGVQVMPTSKDGRVQHYRTLDQELIAAKPSALDEGVLVEITQGKHEGLWGRVRLLAGLTSAMVTLKNGQDVKVKRQHLTILHEAQLRHDGHPYFDQNGTTTTTTTTTTSANTQDSSSTSKRPRDNDDDDQQEEEQHPHATKRSKPNPSNHTASSSSSSSSSSSLQMTPTGPSWLAPDIRVRFVDKHTENGAFYTKKASIVDVLSPYTCTIRFDDHTPLVHAHQNQLETALPKKGGLVKVLSRSSPLYGQVCTLLQRNKSSAQATLQSPDDMQIYTLSYDDVAQYVGP